MRHPDSTSAPQEGASSRSISWGKTQHPTTCDCRHHCHHRHSSSASSTSMVSVQQHLNLDLKEFSSLSSPRIAFVRHKFLLKLTAIEPRVFFAWKSRQSLFQIFLKDFPLLIHFVWNQSLKFKFSPCLHVLFVLTIFLFLCQIFYYHILPSVSYS